MKIAKKLLSELLTIFLISLFVFFIFQVIPGDPVLSQLGSEEIQQNPALAEKLRLEFNLDQPPVQRFFTWVANVLQGDLGTSFKFKVPVATMIKNNFKPTIVLTILSMILTIIIAIPLGISVGKRREEGSQVFSNVLSQLGLAIPQFWLAIVLMGIFSLKLKLLPTRALVDFSQPAATLKSLILPVVTLSLGNISLVIRYLLNSISDEKNKAYVTYAKAKGLTDEEVLNKHILKNSMIALVTVLGLNIIGMLTGSILVENIFNIQGLGSLMINAIADNDYPLVQGLVLIYSIIVVVVNTILDIIYAKIDPRISL